MTIFVAGGSNSVFRGGWVEGLARLLPSERVVNASIGATTSTMGLFRLLRQPDLLPGDTVIWEYAVNEANHARRGYDPQQLLRELEHFIRLCSRRGLRLLPVIFTACEDEETPERHGHYARMDAVFDHYGLARFDLSETWRKTFGVARIAAECYFDPFHYALTPAYIDLAAGGVAQMLPDAQVPPERAPLYTGASSVVLTDPPEGGSLFSNSILEVMLGPLPRTQMVMPVAGRVLCFYALCRPFVPAGLRILLRDRQVSARWLRMSTTVGTRADDIEDEEDAAGETVQFKAISLTRATGGPWICHAGDVLEVTPLEQGGLVYAELKLIPRLTSIAQPHQPAFAGALIEVDD